MNIPIKEIEYLANFVEADTENDLYEISEAVMEKVNIVREWLKAAEHSAHPTLLPARHKLVSCPQCKLMFGVDLPASQSG